MKLPSLKSVLFVVLIFSLSAHTSLYGDTFTDQAAFEAAVGGVTTINFEGIATEGGQAGAVNLNGDEFPGVTLTAGAGSEGLYVGIPDLSVHPTNNRLNFFAADFFPTSGVACFSPDLNLTSGSPVGNLIVDFDSPTTGVGAFFLDVEGGGASIEAFDGPGGTGNSLGKLTLGNQGDNSQAFAGIVASGIRSAVLVIGGGNDGVGIDDLVFGALCTPVDIDIKPGSYPNSINPGEHGVLPVAVLGSPTFDVSTIDLSEPITLGGTEVTSRGPAKAPKLAVSFEDVDGDGLMDLVAFFSVQELVTSGALTIDTIELKLEAKTTGGVPISGTDTVNIVPPE